MNVIVLGAGVVGVAQAWYLAMAGFSVTVIEQAPGPGLETSYANGGQISACHTQPWAGPNTFRQAAGWVGKPDAPLVVHPWRFDPPLWRWGFHFLKNCTRAAYFRNMERAIHPALYSRSCLKTLRADLGLTYDARALGILKIYRSPAALAEGDVARKAAIPWGLEQTLLTPAQCIDLEPALESARAHLEGGIFAPDDESGDAFVFTNELARCAREKGVTFLYNTRVVALERQGKTLSRVLTDKGDFTPDAVVMTLGCASPVLARSLGVYLPIYPVKGYSITIDLPTNKSSDRKAVAAPFVSITDEERRMVYSRLGNRLRCAGTAEFAGFDKTLDPRRLNVIRTQAASLFPALAGSQDATGWCGLRPTTPDNAPIVGAVPGLDNLYVNTGHGTLGWTMACGTGKAVSDLVQGRKPEIDLAPLNVQRFRGFRGLS